jgi:RimJ/RimL family protein N-acetyltransferase
MRVLSEKQVPQDDPLRGNPLVPKLQSLPLIELNPLAAAEARQVALWRYEAPYNFYDGSEAEVSVMLDPANQYRAVHVDSEFVGYVCVGPDAMVSGQEVDPEVNDIGWGFRPDLTGRGLASRWLPMVLDLLGDLLHAPTQRVVIAAWNERSLAVALRLGFENPVPLKNADGDWVVLSRSRRRAN